MAFNIRYFLIKITINNTKHDFWSCVVTGGKYRIVSILGHFMLFLSLIIDL